MSFCLGLGLGLGSGSGSGSGSELGSGSARAVACGAQGCVRVGSAVHGDKAALSGLAWPGLAWPDLPWWPGLAWRGVGLAWLAWPNAHHSSPQAPGDSPHPGMGRATLETSGGLCVARPWQPLRRWLRPLLLPPIHGFSAGEHSGWNGSCLVLVKSMRSCAATLTCKERGAFTR